MQRSSAIIRRIFKLSIRSQFHSLRFTVKSLRLRVDSYEFRVYSLQFTGKSYEFELRLSKEQDLLITVNIWLI